MKTLIISFLIWLAINTLISIVLAFILSVVLWKSIVICFFISIFMYILNTFIIVLNNVRK